MNNNISEKDMFMLMMENAEKKDNKEAKFCFDCPPGFVPGRLQK